MLIRARRYSAGFSMIELAIALTIIGVLMAGLMEAHKASTLARSQDTTQARFWQIQTALEEFLTKNGRLPCPARADIPPTHLEAGVEQCIGEKLPSAATLTGRCVTPANVITVSYTGMCVLRGRYTTDASPPAIAGVANSIVTDRVSAWGAGWAALAPYNTPTHPQALSTTMIGAVPYVTLGIDLNESLDGWGRKIKYAVASIMTKKEYYHSSLGSIYVMTPTSGNALGTGTKAGSGHMVLLSGGPNGKGVYTLSGGLFAACGTAAAGRDFYNCDGVNSAASSRPGSSFYNGSDRSFVPGASYYDDIVHPIYEVNKRDDKWSYVAAAQTKIRNTSDASKVGIGTKAPTHPLTVEGGLRAERVAVEKVCEEDPATGAAINCFTPNILTTVGLDCDGGGFEGIKNASSECLNTIKPGSLTPGADGAACGAGGAGVCCGAGKVMTGVDAAGRITCTSIY